MLDPPLEPDESVRVYLTGASLQDSIFLEDLCDENSIANFAVVPEGKVWAYHTGRGSYGAAMAEGTVTGGGELKILLEATSDVYSLAGTVVNADQKPVSGAQIFIHYPNKFLHEGAYNLTLSVSVAAVSDSLGKFELSGVPANTYCSIFARYNNLCSNVVQAHEPLADFVLTLPRFIKVSCRILTSDSTTLSGRLVFIPLSMGDYRIPISYPVDSHEVSLELPIGSYAVAWQLSLGEGLWPVPVEVSAMEDELVLDLRAVSGFTLTLRTATQDDRLGIPSIMVRPLGWNPLLKAALPYLDGRLVRLDNHDLQRRGLLPGDYQCAISLPDGMFFQTVVRVIPGVQPVLSVDPLELSIVSLALSKAGAPLSGAFIELRRRDGWVSEGISVQADASGFCRPIALYPAEYEIWLLADSRHCAVSKPIGTVILQPGVTESLKIDIGE